MTARIPKHLLSTGIAALLLVAVVACSTAQSTGPDLSSLSAQEAVAQGAAAIEAANSFDFELSHVSGSTLLAGNLDLQRAEGTVKRPGDMSLTAEANFGRAFVRTEAVIIGTETWMTNPLTGTWASVPPEESPFGFFDPLKVVADILENVIEPEFDGEPGVDNTVRVTGRLQAAVFEPLVGTVSDTLVDVTLVFDASTMRLEKATVSGAMQPSDADSAERVIELSNYDGEVDISPPT